MTKKAQPRLDRDWLTARQAQEYLQISFPTLVRWINEGKLQAVKPGRDWRISASSVEKLLNRN